MNAVNIYPAPKDAVKRDDFIVEVRADDQEAWQALSVYEVKVDMHHVRKASMAYFDMKGTVEVRVTCQHINIEEVAIRPLSYGLSFEQLEKNMITFTLDQPRKISIEVNGDRFHNLHLFANPFEDHPPLINDKNVFVVNPGIHRTEDILKGINNNEKEVIYFTPGMHYLEEVLLDIPSGKTVYVAGGAVVVGSFACRHVENVTIRGRGVVYLSSFHHYSAFRGVIITFSKHINVEGIITIDPPHYSIYIGESSQINIKNFKSFSTRQWSDGIDMMSSSHVHIDDVFLRTSDDSIAIYGSRWDFSGGTHHVKVKNSILWADVAHASNIGTHSEKDGDVIENIKFENIDILEHHELQENYWGALAISAGDKNIVRNVHYKGIRIEQFELGQLLDVRVLLNEDYNPVPGKAVENICFEDLEFNGVIEHPSRIQGFDEQRKVKNISFINLTINGKVIREPTNHLFVTNEFIEDLTFS